MLCLIAMISLFLIIHSNLNQGQYIWGIINIILLGVIGANTPQSFGRIWNYVRSIFSDFGFSTEV